MADDKNQDRKHSRKKGEHKEPKGKLGTGLAEHARKSLGERGDVITRHVDRPKNDDD